jgi:hypothetical protein
MSIKYCGCIRRKLIVAQTIGKYLHKQYQCEDCGRTFFEQERIITKEDLLTPFKKFEEDNGITKTRDDLPKDRFSL